MCTFLVLCFVMLLHIPLPSNTFSLFFQSSISSFYLVVIKLRPTMLNLNSSYNVLVKTEFQPLHYVTFKKLHFDKRVDSNVQFYRKCITMCINNHYSIRRRIKRFYKLSSMYQMSEASEHIV